MSLTLKIHIATIYLSYAAFLVAAAAAVLYLIQNNALKNKQTVLIFSRLPGLSVLDKLTYRSIGFGFPVLTLSILSGYLWMRDMSGAAGWGCNPRQVFTIALWLMYALILHVRLSAKLRGRPVAFLSVLAFLIILLSLFGTCH